MSKKRFVEFYLAAMMKAATDGRVSKLTYQYVEGGKSIPAMECVTVVLEDRSGIPVPVQSLGDCPGGNEGGAGAVIMGVDIETYSSVDLTKAEARPYTEAPDFTILLISYKVDDQPTRIIDLVGNGDGDLTLLPPVPYDLPAGDLEGFCVCSPIQRSLRPPTTPRSSAPAWPGTLTGLCPRNSGAARWCRRPPWGCRGWPR